MVDAKDELFVELLSLGFDENAIKRAIALTTDKDKAIELILNFQEDEKIDSQPQQQQQQQNQQGQNIDLSTVKLFQGYDPLQLLNIAQQQQQNQDDGRNYKMIFLVRMDLKMGVGKIAAQVGHAAVGAYQQMVTIIESDNQDQEEVSEELIYRCRHVLNQWQLKGSAKIVLKVETKEELVQLEQQASSKGINTCLIEDAGKTQVDPNTITVCAIGPDEDQIIDQLTKHLKLL